MAASPEVDGGYGTRAAAPTIIVQTQSSTWKSWTVRLLGLGLAISLMANVGMYSSYRSYFERVEPPLEKLHSGDALSQNKLAVLTVSGTIMPPFTERLIKQVQAAAKDADVKGVLLTVDSPGGLVADSHQIYHELKQLSEKKPVFVQMKRMAASGGYYIAMGAGPQGRIFAEPTTWTGSIGVIIPRFDAAALVEKIGVASDPLKTGPFKDALSPFRPLDDAERKIWENILGQSFAQFVNVIDTNRENLDETQVKALATGQIYTASDALANGLVDVIGYENDALNALRERVGGGSFRVITYTQPTTLTDVLLGDAHAKSPAAALQTWLSASVPQAFYLCSWLPGAIITPAQ
jgi:protease IV